MQLWNKIFIKISKLVDYKKDKERTYLYIEKRGGGDEEDEKKVNNFSNRNYNC